MNDQIKHDLVKTYNRHAAERNKREISKLRVTELNRFVTLLREQYKRTLLEIGAGTGLGAAHLVWQHDHYHAYSSESGHTGFAPENPLQTELLAWMQQQHSHVSLEMILSGKGLVTIYQFLHQLKHYPESPQVQEKMKLNDAAEVITESALTEGDVLCQAALDCFIDIYGAAAGNIALNYYPVAELYIAGGIAAKIKDKMLGPAFIAAFTNKGLLSLKMKSVTIKLVLQDKVGLYGALAMLKRSWL
jgi:glucokinase